ncbi:MAG: hypothetical protein ACM3PY_13870 [Omnitrophica WOR_2 bacterium]
MFKRTSLLILTLFILSACVPSTPSVSNTPVTSATLSATTAPTSRPTITEPSATPTHIPVDLTPAQRAAEQALSKDKGIPIEQIQLTSTEAVQWPDGCLGVVIPGVMCTQQIVDGFRIILSANGKQYEYHTNQDGTSVIAADRALSSTIQIAFRALNNSIQMVDTQVRLDPANPPSFNGFGPAGGVAGGKLYVLDLSGKPQVLAIGSGGAPSLDFIKDPSYGLAIRTGEASNGAQLAWGTQPISPTLTSSLQIGAPDGSQLQTLISGTTSSSPLFQYVAQRWSADGKSLYFSKEPYGIGGYILFAGASNLYRIDLQDKQITELIPPDPKGALAICLDALSGDERLVAEHCKSNEIAVLDLGSGQSSSIQPPADIKEFKQIGSSRFSPDGKRLAYALAKGDPAAEQGWVAVSDSLSGASKLILTSQAGQYYTVLGWLDANTLLIQSNGIQCSPTCVNEIWKVSADGKNQEKLTEGVFLTLANGFQP